MSPPANRPPAWFASGRRPWLWLALWSLLLTFGLYGRALALPFFSDDFFQLPFLARHALPQLWQTAEGLFFFRPLAFTLWHALARLGGMDPGLFHLANLLLHALNGLLVAVLTAVLWGAPGRPHWARGAVAATLFLLFPFSYEAVAWVAAVMHPLFLALTLGSILAYLQARRAVAWRRPAWLALGLLLALLSPLAHENGVLVAPLTWLVAVTRPGPGPFWRRAGWAWLWLLPMLVWYVYWRQVPAASSLDALALNDGRTLWRNALYFVQGASYPLAWMGGWWRDRLGVDGFLVAAALALPAALLALLAQWRPGFSRRAWLPWLWTAVAAAPAVLLLSWPHVGAAPRMLMLASVGIAWLWCDVLWALAGWGRRPPWRRRTAAALALLLALLVQNVRFVQAQMNLYALGGGAIRAAVAAAVAANGAGDTAVFINFPSWIAPRQATYAIGQEGDVFVLGADMMPDLVWAHTGRPAMAVAVRYEDIRPVDLPYYTGPLGAGPDWPALAGVGAQVWRTAYAPAAITTEAAGRLPAPRPAAPLAVFDSGVGLAATAMARLEGVQVNLTWQAGELPPADVTVFVHGLDGAGRLVAQADGDPLAGTYALALWPPQTTLLDRRLLPGADIVAVRVGLYHRATGARLPAQAPTGAPYPENAVPVPIAR